MKHLSHKIMSEITTFMKYSKFVPELNRRETWVELINRNRDMHIKKYPFLREEITDVYKNFVETKKVLPSMRSMQFAGKPIELNESRIYNCSFIPMESWEAFHEIMFLLLGGIGVGFSVQRIHVSKIPSIRKPTKRKKFVVSDDIIGWSESVKALVRAYLDGSFYPEFDFSDIRPKGSPLKTTGGVAPGPEPLKKSLSKVEEIFESKQNGQKLTSLEVHDIVCYLADAVLAGGIRRSALISLFNMNDDLMINCKSNMPVRIIQEDKFNEHTFQVYVETESNSKIHHLFLSLEDYEDLKVTGTLPWWYFEPQRGRANNSAVFLRYRVTESDFQKFWDVVKNNKYGEPGIYFSNNPEWGANPCVEIGLRPYQFCNLTEINGGDIIDQNDLNERARAASFLASLQAGYSDFHYLRDIWRENTERDALLGVSITGVASLDLEKISLKTATESVIAENIRVSKIIGTNPAARLTCVKPSGTTSLVLGTSSGCHAWFSKYYIRRMKVTKKEAIYNYLKAVVPELIEDDHFNPKNDAFVKIPMMAPAGSVTKDSESTMQFLNRIKKLGDDWIKPGHLRGDNSHNVSATVFVRNNEWDQVGKWMWDNRDSFNGLAILPFDDAKYIQAPHEEISQEVYESLSGHLNDINLSNLVETKDTTSRREEVACAGGACDLVH